MSPNHDILIQQLFRDCLQLDPRQRDSFLAERCAADAALRGEVESLLDHHEAAGGILDRPAAVVSLDADAPDERTAVAPGLALVGQTLGDEYRILEFLGHGGMGAVYLAEQTGAMRRRVALKILRDPSGSRDVLARFASERQALALMDHPNIARIFDAGSTIDGRPYFTMEHVPGVALTEYCDQHRLELEARLRLFQLVCDGVQHAHQKGILHRDLKPSNILVSVRGGSPVPKIIDFGVAKALHQRLTDVTLHTAHGFLVGTPDYMSPEQATTGGRDVDTRADIYSLGALLYELVTGLVPLDLRNLGDGGLAELQRRVAEDEPLPPSARLLRDERAREATQARHLAPDLLSRKVRGELDWIIQMALAKDRTRRYGTASELAADIGRFLDQEPVSAGPPGMGYRLKVTARRHRRLLISASVVMGILVIATVVSTGFAIQAQRDRRAAVAAQSDAVRLRVEAELSAEEAKRAEQVAADALDYFLGLFGKAMPHGGGTQSLTLRDALASADAELAELVRTNPDVGAVVAAQIGEFHFAMDNRDASAASLRLALARFRQVPTLDPEQHGTAAKLLAMIERDRGNLAAARELLEETYLAYQDESPNYFDLPMVRDLEASIFELEGNPDAALELRISTAASYPNPTGDLALNVGHLNSSLGVHSLRRGELEQAEAYFLRSLELSRLGSDVTYYQAGACSGRGEVYLRRGQPADAVRWFQTGLDALMEAAEEDNWQRAVLSLGFAEAQLRGGQLATADSVLAQMEPILLRDSGSARTFRIRAQRIRSEILGARGRFPEARRVAEAADQLAGPDPTPESARLAAYQGFLAETRGESALAGEFLTRAVSHWDAMGGQGNPERAAAMARLQALSAGERIPSGGR